MRHRGRARVLAAAGAMALLGACGMDQPYQPLDGGQRDTVPELHGARAQVSCADVDPTAWLVAPSDASAVDLVRADDAPPPPGSQPTKGTTTSSTELPTIDAVIDEERIPDAPDRRAALETSGFETGVSTGFGNAPVPHRVRALRFRDAAGALDHVGQRMVQVCQEAGSLVFALGDGGVAFADAAGRGVGVFVLGREEISLILPADTSGDLIELIEGWHEAWLAAHASGPAQPVG